MPEISMEKLQKKLEQAKERVHILENMIEERTRELYLKNLDLNKRNKDLENFVYLASHDLQEPLQTIVSFTELLQEDIAGKMNDEFTVHLNFIVQAAGRMRNLIQALLDHSRIGRDRMPEQVDCNHILNHLLADLGSSIKQANAQIRQEELPVLNGYKMELNVLFQNLISNAIKYRKPDVNPEVEITSTLEKGQWKFAVKDNGIGIEEKHKEKIFMIFQRLHAKNEYEGTGIGLAHCKKIVELHGGEIWVESIPGQGSIFYFTIENKKV